VGSLIAFLGQAAEEGAEAVSDKKDLYPHLAELIVAALAFAILFAFMTKMVIPRINTILEQRRDKIQGDLESAEKSKGEAEQLLADYRKQLANARDEANRVIEEARQTAEQMRRDLETRAQQEARSIVERAQEEIRAERDRVFQELKAQVGELSLALAGRMVGESLDRDRHLRLVDQYIRELAAVPSGNGNGHGGQAPAQESGAPAPESGGQAQTEQSGQAPESGGQAQPEQPGQAPESGGQAQPEQPGQAPPESGGPTTGQGG
jgi:F-type H+-transporting ATPase subunit b